MKISKVSFDIPVHMYHLTKFHCTKAYTEQQKCVHFTLVFLISYAYAKVGFVLIASVLDLYTLLRQTIASELSILYYDLVEGYSLWIIQ